MKSQGTVKVGITLDQTTFNKLENACSALGITKSSYIALQINSKNKDIERGV